jgi:hypothetical protein
MMDMVNPELMAKLILIIVTQAALRAVEIDNNKLNKIIITNRKIT